MKMSMASSTASWVNSSHREPRSLHGGGRVVNQMEVVLYVSSKRSLRCWRAKGLLARKGYYVKVIQTTNEELGELLMPFGQDLSHKKTVPYVFIDHRPVGGFSDIRSLERKGILERLIRGAV